MKREGNFEALVETIRSKLIAGYIIAVIGWRDSNHSKDTRRYKESGKVIFVLKPPDSFGLNVGYVIYPKWVKHRHVQELKKTMGKRVHPVVLQIDDIRRLFKRCEDLLFIPTKKKQKLEEVFIAPCSSVVQPFSVPQLPEVVALVAHVESVVETERIFPQEAVSMADTPLAENPQPQVAERPKPDYVRFANRFLEEARKDKEGLVGKRTLGEIRRECGLDHLSNTDLVKEGLIEPITREGLTKVGRYMATDKLHILLIEKAPEEPQGITLKPGDDLYEIHSLVQSEPDLQYKIADIRININDLQHQLFVLENQLKKVLKAKEMKAAFKALISEES